MSNDLIEDIIAHLHTDAYDPSIASISIYWKKASKSHGGLFEVSYKADYLPEETKEKSNE